MNADYVDLDYSRISYTSNGRKRPAWILTITEPGTRSIITQKLFSRCPSLMEVVSALDNVTLRQVEPCKMDNGPAPRNEDERLEIMKDWTVEQADYFLEQEELLISMGHAESSAEEIAFYEASRFYETEAGGK